MVQSMERGEGNDMVPLDWEKLKWAFLDRFSPFEMRLVKVLDYINL